MGAKIALGDACDRFGLLEAWAITFLELSKGTARLQRQREICGEVDFGARPVLDSAN